MAAPAPSDKVKDKEYANWLKVTLALYYMKSGLHTFIQSEVDCLHQSLVHKIYGGQTVPLPPCTMCHASRVKRNKYIGVWAFQKRCRSCCDVWLDELLVLHTNPKSEKIYWNNSDITSWPFKPWECAKVFMPRGQQPSNAGPAECDAQALLTLLVNCTHFHPKLSPQGLGLTHAISVIRNKVIHDGEMKLSDADRMNSIQQIIQLLEDPVSLKSLEDCKAAVGNIHKINNDSLDVFFNLDIEMAALRAAVNELRLEHGMQEKRTLDTVESLNEDYKHLREQLTKRFEDVEKDLELHGTRMDTIQRDVQSVKEQTDTALKQQEEKHQEMHATVTHMSESMETMSVCIAEHGAKYVTVEESLEVFGTKLQVFEANILTQRKNSSGRKRKAAGEGVSVCDKSAFQHATRSWKAAIEGCRRHSPHLHEAQAKRRPESDGLRQLKNQTEDNLDTFRKIGFIPTTQTEEAKKLLQEKRSIVIKGKPGEGKTSTALYLIDNDDYRNQRVMVSSPRQWKKVDTDWVKILVLEDIFGQYDLDPDRQQEWIDEYLRTIQKHVGVGKLQVIITIRDDILLKAYSKLKSFKLFFNDMTLTLSSKKLKNSDKMSILNRELKRNNKDMNVDEKEQCIANFSGMVGFPQCCFLFAGDTDLFDQGPKFFNSPEKFLVENITNLKGNSFLSLAFLFCIGKIEEEYLSPSQIKKSKNYLPVLEELALYLNVSFNESTIISLRESYDHYSGLYVRKVVSYKRDSGMNFLYEHHSGGNVGKSCIQFSHATVYEAVGQVLGDSCPEMVVKYGDSEYLYQRTYTAEAKDSTSQNVFIPMSVYGLLVERMVQDVVKGKRLVERVVNHSALKQHQFLMTLKDHLHKGDRIKEFFMANKPVGKDLSEGACITFLQYILQRDENVVRLVYSQFLEFLACAHNNKSTDCWQCEEKQKLLELALYYHHFEIADKLITMNACYTRVSLCNVARHGDVSRIQTVLECLKRSLVFNPECIEAKEALCRTYLSGNQDVIEILLQEGITLDSKHVVYAVQHGDMNVLMKVVEHLKCHNKWDPHREKYRTDRSFVSPDMYSGIGRLVLVKIPCSTALYITYCNEKFDMADHLMINEVKVSMDMLAYVSKYSSQQVVARVIQNLKVTGTWDPHCDDASEALENAYMENKYDVCDMLIQEGVSLTIKNLPVVKNGFQASLESVKKAIQHLKDTDSWDPKCEDASEALNKASRRHMYDVFDLLVHEGVPLPMKLLPGLIFGRSLDYVKTAVKLLKDTDSWDPKCNDASEALEIAYSKHKYDVCNLLIQEGVSLTIKHLPVMVGRFQVSLESVKKAIQHLKDTNSWDPKCDDASEALEKAYGHHKYDVCDLLVHEGVPLTVAHLPHIIMKSLDYVKTAVKQLKDTERWDSKCKDASEALEIAYSKHKYDVCDLLIQEGVSLTMKNLINVISTSAVSLESVKKAVQYLKDTVRWDPKCDDASEVLVNAYKEQKYDVCDMLVHEGVSLTMKNLPGLVMGFGVSLESVKKAIQHLKDTNSWDPKCDDASEAIEKAYRRDEYDVFDLMVHEGVSLTMKHLPHIIMRSLDYVKTAVKQLKDTDSWDSKCDDASEALEIAYGRNKYDVCDLLIQEGVSLTMKKFASVIRYFRISLESVKKAIQHLKDSDSWDPHCDDASEALENAYSEEQDDLCDLLIQEGVSLTMKNLPGLIMRFLVSLESVRKAIQHLKDTNQWDSSSDYAVNSLAKTKSLGETDMYNLLIKEGVFHPELNKYVI